MSGLMTTELTTRINHIQATIQQNCERYQRPFNDVNLIAVSKTRSAAEIAAVYDHAIHHFGENYLQEALPKIAALAHLSAICWHYIGRIQRNKTQSIATHFDWVHTVTNARHARRLSEQRPTHKPTLNVCIQVNIDNEVQKNRVSVTELGFIVDKIQQLPRLKLRGLMCIPQSQDIISKQRATFKRLRELQQHINQQHHLALDTLSMGMSADYVAAIAEGATMLRLGTAIFGPRSSI